MGQDSIELPTARSALVVIASRLLDQADIRGAFLACRIRCMRSDARSRDLPAIRFQKIHAPHLMSVALRVAPGLTRFRAVRLWRSICALRLSQSYNDWMRSSVVR